MLVGPSPHPQTYFVCSRYYTKSNPVSNYVKATTQVCSWLLECLTLQYGTNMLFRNVGNRQTMNAAQRPRRVRTPTLNRSATCLMLLPFRKAFRIPFIFSALYDCSVFRLYFPIFKKKKRSKYVNHVIYKPPNKADIFFSPMAQQPLMGQGLLII